MKKCTNCQNDVPKNYVFCPHCGQKFPPPERYCTHCGQKMEPGHVFCFDCGARFGSDREQPRPTSAQNPPQYEQPNEQPNEQAYEHEFEPRYASAQNEQPQYEQPQQYQQGNGTFEHKITVNYRLGGGNTAFSSKSGSLEVSSTEVRFTSWMGSNHNHSYALRDIQSTQFKMVRLGIVPQAGYIVTLKNGVEHCYYYSPLLKSKLT